MKKARLMNKPEDYKKIGVKPDIIEAWEDGRRDDGRPGAAEVWYFDFVMEDGTKLVLAFRPKSQDHIAVDGDDPNIGIFLTTPDGVTHADYRVYTPDEVEMSKDGCYLKYGPHSLIGDLKEYKIKIYPEEPKKIVMDGVVSEDHGIGIDLHFESLTKPFRPGTGYISLGEKEEYYNTFMCIPKGRATGNITFAGKTYEVKGEGYQNHQWMNINHMKAWHHWLWGRQTSGDYTVVIFDLITTEEFGFTRIPLLGIWDKDGEIIFENHEDVKCDILEWSLQEETQKYYPKLIKYTFENSGKKVEYTIKWINEISIRDFYGVAPDNVRAEYDRLGIQPTYTRYYADAELVITEGDITKKSSGDMIYEFAYYGKPDERAHL